MMLVSTKITENAQTVRRRLDVSERVRDEIPARPLGRPRRTDQIDAGRGLDGVARKQQFDVGRVGEEFAPKERGGIERVVVAGQQVDRQLDFAQRLHTSHDRAPVELVVRSPTPFATMSGFTRPSSVGPELGKNGITASLGMVQPPGMS